MALTLAILAVLALIFAVMARLSEDGKPYQWIAVLLMAIALLVQYASPFLLR